MNRRNKQRKDRILRQVILACPTCGTPNGNCLHRDGIMAMTKARAAALAISTAFADPVDFKSRAAGERE